MSLFSVLTSDPCPPTKPGRQLPLRGVPWSCQSVSPTAPSRSVLFPPKNPPRSTTASTSTALPAPRRRDGRPPTPAAAAAAALAVRLHAAARAVAGRPRRRAPRRVHAQHLRHLLQVPHRARHGPRAAPPLRGPRQAPRPPRRCAPLLILRSRLITLRPDAGRVIWLGFWCVQRTVSGRTSSSSRTSGGGTGRRSCAA